LQFQKNIHNAKTLSEQEKEMKKKTKRCVHILAIQKAQLEIYEVLQAYMVKNYECLKSSAWQETVKA
jgi:hypothetical protein